MSNEKVLITGAAGLLGSIWCNLEELNTDYILGEHKNPVKSKKWSAYKLDFSNESQLSNFLEFNRVDRVVNTIGLTNVERCQEDKDLAHYLNVHIPGVMAKSTKLVGCKFIHISTDHLYGNINDYFTESDPVVLMNEYANSKYKGEVNVLNSNSNSLVCRTNFFGYGNSIKKSFSDFIETSVNQRKNIYLFDDVYFNPVNGLRLIEIANNLSQNNCSGIYNISANNVITKYNFGLKLCKALGIDSKYIKKGSLNGERELVTRPTCMGLSNKKTSEQLAIDIGDIDFQIKLLVDNA